MSNNADIYSQMLNLNLETEFFFSRWKTFEFFQDDSGSSF